MLRNQRSACSGISDRHGMESPIGMLRNPHIRLPNCGAASTRSRARPRASHRPAPPRADRPAARPVLDSTYLHPLLKDARPMATMLEVFTEAREPDAVDDCAGGGEFLARVEARRKEVGAIPLADRWYSTRLMPSKEELHELEERHGRRIETWWKESFGHAFDCLTHSQAPYLARSPDADTIRDRPAAVEQAGDLPGSRRNPRSQGRYIGSLTAPGASQAPRRQETPGRSASETRHSRNAAPSRWARRLPMRDEILHAHAYILGDPAQQNRGHVPAGMHGHRCPATIGMGELLVRPSVPNLYEAEPKQHSNHLPWLQDREAGHSRSSRDRLNPLEFGLQLGKAIFQEHRDDLAEVLGQFVQATRLRVRARKTGNIAHEQTSLEILFDNDGKSSHGFRTLGLSCGATANNYIASYTAP